jgi:thiamine biosynthesis protein ThiS
LYILNYKKKKKNEAQNGVHHRKGVRPFCAFFCGFLERVGKVKVNGAFIKLEEQQTLYDYLMLHNYNLGIIVVERNGEIVPKDTYQEVLLNNEDTIEVVTFVGGG